MRKGSSGLARRIGRASLVALTLAVAGCELFVYADRDVLDAGMAGHGGGGAASSSSASTSGSGGGACLLPIDCPGEDTACAVRTCEGGVCGNLLLAAGTPTADQVSGDCVRQVCDGAGNAKLIADDLDVPIDGDPCTDDVCTAGTPVNPISGAGKPCSIGGGQVCDGAGHCVACVSAAECAGGACVNNTCVSLSCTDGQTDGAETDLDCGGPDCLPCAIGKGCKVDADCNSGVCSGNPGQCQSPACDDGVQNGFESDIDCGGDCLIGCAAGAKCLVDLDCAGGACVAGACAASCSDGEKNQDETALDCGGGCAPCANGAACVIGLDCASGICAAAACAAPDATCASGAKDGTESDVDCGGAACAPCAVGAACAVDSDCASRRCVTGSCAPIVLISEVRSRGLAGSHDEFVELYNPLSTPVTLTTSFTLSARSAIGACDTNADKVLFTGSGEVIAPHGHLLLGGSDYTPKPAADALLAAAGVPDAGSVVLAVGGVPMDAVCFAYDDVTAASLAGCAVPFTCEGPPASNLPHDNTQSAAANTDASLVRKPGGPLGSGRDTGSSLADFRLTAPAEPESSASMPVP